MDVRQLEVFCKVWEEKSFSRAARALGLSQPTVSGHVAALEREVGARLFDRVGREVEATRAGEFLYPHARLVLQAREEAQRALEGFLGLIRGELRIAASTIPGEILLPPHIGRFKALHPEVRVRMAVLDSRRVIEAVKEGEFEMGVAGARPRDASLRFQPFGSDELILVVSWKHPLAKKGALTPRMLEEAPLVVREAGSGTQAAAEEKLQALGLDPSRLQIVAEMGDSLAVLNAVRAGVGAAIVSRLAAQDELSSGTLKEVPIRGFRCLREFFTLTHKARTLSPACGKFLEFLHGEGEKGR